jgi:hypothetical protein
MKYRILCNDAKFEFKTCLFTQLSGWHRSTSFEHSYLTEITPEGTKVISRMQMEPGGLLGLAEPLIAKNLKKDFRASLIALKNLLEKQAVGAS